MSLVLSSADSRLLHNLLTNGLVSIMPDTESSTDLNGNQADSNEGSNVNLNLKHLSLTPSDSSNVSTPSSDITAIVSNSDRQYPVTLPMASSLSLKPAPMAPAYSMTQKNASLNLNLAKINDDRHLITLERTFHACSPIDEECTGITVTSATLENIPDSNATESKSITSAITTPGSSKDAIGSSDIRHMFKYPVIRRSDITFRRLIGRGGFGTVHEGTIAGHPVAIKVVKKRRGSGVHREIVQAERLAHRLNLRHRNIVVILGVNTCDDLRGDALIAMELVTSRSLQELLDNVARPLHRTERLRFASEIASALNYLHSNHVVHLDVKPANVLMTSQFVCKLSDFGNLTRTMENSAREDVEFTQLLGTLPYRAPELMRGVFPTTKADLYSFGILLWQMVTRELPHKNANPHWLIYQVVKCNIRPYIPNPGTDMEEVVYQNLYTACWDRDLLVRPCARKVLEILNRLRQKIL